MTRDYEIDYDKVGLLVQQEGRILLCRKRRGTDLLILPGGCVEGDESAEQCLQREIEEELGGVELVHPEYLGVYRDKAAGDLSKTVQIRLYGASLKGEPSPQSEIAALVWFGPHDDRSRLSPSLARKILPDLVSRGILPASWA